MTVAVSYPGVYIEEVPSGVRTVAGVATSVTAFLGRALRGPADQPLAVNSYGEFERSFGGLWTGSTLGFAVRDFFLNGGGQAIVVRIHNGAATASLQLQTATANTPVLLAAASAGAWGNGLSAAVDHETKDQDNPALFNLSVSDGAAGTRERFFNLSIQSSDARYYPRVLEQGSALVRAAKDAGGNYVNLRPQATGGEAATATGGSDGSALTLAQFDGVGYQAGKKGLYALEKADLFNLLCIPPYLASSPDVDAALVATAAAYCEARRAILIVDPPSRWGTTDDARSVTGAGTTSKNAALYFPRLVQPNPLRENQLETFAPCGAVAGVIARTDTQRGIWKAPAGLDAALAGVTALTVPLTDAENGELNPLGVNCLRALPSAGRVVWGARTLQGNDVLASDWKYLPVRRLALHIEESLYRGTQWAVFEPNDEPLWAQIRASAGAFMHGLFRKGAFQGQSPKEAYFVKCDGETTTQNDVNLGTVNVVVGFAPLKPAEFVVIKIQQMAGQVER